jgi:hypothetical protein
MLILTQVHYSFFLLLGLRYSCMFSFLYFWLSCRKVTTNRKLAVAVTVFYDPTHVHVIASILIFVIGNSVPLHNNFLKRSCLIGIIISLQQYALRF